MHKIYYYTQLTPQNTITSLDTLYLLSCIDNHFTLKEIAIFYNQHPNSDPITYNDHATLSLSDVFLTNKKISAFLELKDSSQSDVFHLITKPITKINIFSFINENTQQIINYLNTQGIFNETTLASAIIISKNKELKIPKYKNVSLEQLFALICEPCLIRYSTKNEEFRKQLFLEFKNQNNLFGVLMTVKDEFLNLEYFKSTNIYFLYLERKIIVEEDVNEIIRLILTDDYLSKDNILLENNFGLISEDKSFSKKNNYLLDNSIYSQLISNLKNKKYNKLPIYSQLIELSNKTKEDCLQLIVNSKKDFGLLTEKRFLLFFQNNSYFTKKYMRNYILENIPTNDQLIYYQCFQALLMKTKPPIIENYDFLQESEKVDLLNLYLLHYKIDKVFGLCMLVGTEQLVGMFEDPLYNLIYMSKYSGNIINSTELNSINQLEIKIKIWLSMLSSKKLALLIKNGINFDFLIPFINYTLLEESSLKTFVSKCTHQVNLIETLTNLNIYFDYLDLINPYDPNIILPLVLKLITNKCTLKIAKKAINYINEVVLTDDFFEEYNLYIIKNICDKVVSVEDKILEKMRMETASKLQKYAGGFEKRLKIRKLD